MSDQPEALRLAEFCDFNVLYQPAAAELRRLHEENKELRHATGVANQTIAAVVAQRDELLEALRGIAMHTRRSTLDPTDIVPTAGAILARAAIKKAEGTE